jgi:hypothetical protein
MYTYLNRKHLVLVLVLGVLREHILEVRLNSKRINRGTQEREEKERQRQRDKNRETKTERDTSNMHKQKKRRHGANGR